MKVHASFNTNCNSNISQLYDKYLPSLLSILQQTHDQKQLRENMFIWLICLDRCLSLRKITEGSQEKNRAGMMAHILSVQFTQLGKS